MDHSTFSLTILQLTLIIMIVGVVFWGVADWARQRKLLPIIEQERTLRFHGEVKRQEETQLATEQQEKAKAQLAEATARQATLERSLVELQDRLTAEVSQAMNKIAELELDLKAAQQQLRDTDTQLTASKSRVTDLEAAIESEKGRIAAMQEAMEAKQDLAKQLTQELSSARHSQLADHEKQAGGGQSVADVVTTELEKTRAAQAELERESDNKLVDLQRKLASDQKTGPLQKEVMAPVKSIESSLEAKDNVSPPAV